jgi:hypothetical protein
MQMGGPTGAQTPADEGMPPRLNLPPPPQITSSSTSSQGKESEYQVSPEYMAAYNRYMQAAQAPMPQVGANEAEYQRKHKFLYNWMRGAMGAQATHERFGSTEQQALANRQLGLQSAKEQLDVAQHKFSMEDYLRRSKHQDEVYKEQMKHPVERITEMIGELRAKGVEISPDLEHKLLRIGTGVEGAQWEPLVPKLQQAGVWSMLDAEQQKNALTLDATEGKMGLPAGKAGQDDWYTKMLVEDQLRRDRELGPERLKQQSEAEKAIKTGEDEISGLEQQFDLHVKNYSQGAELQGPGGGKFTGGEPVFSFPKKDGGAPDTFSAIDATSNPLSVRKWWGLGGAYVWDPQGNPVEVNQDFMGQFSQSGSQVRNEILQKGQQLLGQYERYYENEMNMMAQKYHASRNDEKAQGQLEEMFDQEHPGIRQKIAEWRVRLGLMPGPDNIQQHRFQAPWDAPVDTGIKAQKSKAVAPAPPPTPPVWAGTGKVG